MRRRTRIVATIGPATDPPGMLEQVLRAGVDVVRINFSHGKADEHMRRIKQAREAARNFDRPLAVLADLPGPKLRAILAAPAPLTQGQHITLGEGGIGITEPEVLPALRPGHRVLFDDGRIQGRVLRASPTAVVLHIDVPGTLLPNKGVNLPDTLLPIAALTARDREALSVAAKAGVDWLALSFVRSPEAAHELRTAADASGSHVPILAKIERPEAVARAAEIVQAFDGIMVARGDLGVELPLEQVPRIQKHLIHLARAAGKPVVTATDMLDSMRNNPRPTRAEASDVANAVYDGTDAVMLSGETAVGQYAVEAVMCMDRILIEAETHQQDDAPRGVAVPKADAQDHITHLTCTLAREAGAQAIIAPTVSGRTARLVARHRPAMAIVASAHDPAVQRQLALVWGLEPVQLPDASPGQDRLDDAVHAAFASGAVKVGNLVVVLAGHPREGAGRFPTIRLVRVGEGGVSEEP